MKWLVGLTVLAVAIALYVTWLRPWMRTTPSGRAFLDKIEPMERVLWLKSETILWQRTKIVFGIVLSCLAQAGTIDLTLFLPFVPEQYKPIANALVGLMPMIISLDGAIGEKLRKETTKPIELVAMRTDAPVSVQVAAEQAAAAVNEAAERVKAAGAV